MNLRSVKRALADSRGQNLIEFGLSALMLILLIFGVFEVSRVLFVYTTVADAAKAGVRYAIVRGEDAPATVSQIQTEVQDYLSAAPMNTAIPPVSINVCYGGATITKGVCSGGSNAKGSTVTVSVVYPYDPWVGYYSKFSIINISSTSEGVITW